MVGAYPCKGGKKIEHLLNTGMELNYDTLLVIRVPDSQALRVISRSVFLALVILTLPFIWSIVKGLPSISSVNMPGNDFGSDGVDLEFLDFLLQGLANEGLIKNGDNALIACSGFGAVIDTSRFLSANEIDLVLESDFEQKVLLPDVSFDFALMLGSENKIFVDRILKIGGILVSEVSNELSSDFQKQSNYKIVYLRQYDSTIMAMRKINSVNQFLDFPAMRRPLQLAMEAKKAALKGLEDVLLEPPRKALANNGKYLKKFKYLPDLLGDSLEDYPRRIFIDVGLHEEKNAVVDWFNEFYLTRNQDFEFHSMKMRPEGLSGRPAPYGDILNWLVKNLREDEFVVMKAEAEVVEEMIERGTIVLVDELFLECKNQWQKEERKKSKRAYWECLALYGRLRDEGVAVHQWWD